MSKRIALTALFFLFLTIYNAKSTQIDSLLQVINSSTSDIERSELHLEIANELKIKNKPKAINHARTALFYANKSNSGKHALNATEKIAYIYMGHNDIDSSEFYYSIFFQLADTSEYSESLIRAYRGLGDIKRIQHHYLHAIDMYKHAYKRSIALKDTLNSIVSLRLIAQTNALIGNVNTGIEYNLQALSLIEKTHYVYEPLTINNNIASIYIRLEEYEKALSYLEKAKKIIHNNPDIYPYYIAPVKINLGTVYQKLKRYDDSEKEYQKTLKITQSSKDTTNLVISCINLSALYLTQKKFNKAKKYSLQAFEISKNYNNKVLHANAIANLGDFYAEMKDYQKAIQFYNTGLKTASKYNDFFSIRDFAKKLSDLYAETKQYKKAYELYGTYKTVNDSIFAQEKVKEITRAEMQYQFDKEKSELSRMAKEKELNHQLKERNLRHTRNIMGVSGIIIILSISFAFFIYRHRKEKKEYELTKALVLNRQQSINQQMNPHFIFNTLNSIQNFIYNNKPEDSMKYISDFASLMRIMLNNSQHITIPLNDEIEVLQLYARLEALRFKNKMSFMVDVDNEVNIEDTKIPAYTLQPVLENAIKHGLQPLNGDGYIELLIKKTVEGIACIMNNNGISYSPGDNAGTGNKKHKSVATGLIHKRLFILSHFFKKDFYIRYNKLPEGQRGTSVLINLPAVNLNS